MFAEKNSGLSSLVAHIEKIFKSAIGVVERRTEGLHYGVPLEAH